MSFFYMTLFSIAILPFTSGSGMYTLFSNLLLTAESKAHGRLVAPKTKTSLESFPTPCI